MEHPYSDALVRFIQDHPSVYHVIEGQRRQLLAAGYEQLLESRPWRLLPGGRYFVARNGSALIAFRIPEGDFRGFMMMASHSDSPALKIKEQPEITVEGAYKKLNVEVYGGALLAGVFFFWVWGKADCLSQVNLARRKPLGSWFYPLAKYAFCGVTVIVLVMGAIKGGIG